MLLLLAFTPGCAPLKQYRTSSSVTSQSFSNIWEEGAINGKKYLLGFVEFDDHGWLWDTNQVRVVLDRLKEEDKAGGVMLVAFAHGWKHNAHFEDDNVVGVRKLLVELQKTENENSSSNHVAPRKVVGVYLGWRGKSYAIPVIKEFSFWERKRTAHMVGNGAVGGFLVRVEELRKVSNITNAVAIEHRERQPMMLITIGHSFGGAVVYSALAPVLEERLIDTVDYRGRERAPRGFGDLVVLINPAFEAARFESLRRTASMRSYFTNQPATIAIFTSHGDDATKLAFPAGRLTSTVFERHRDLAQYGANLTAIGHYEPYRTHELLLRDNSKAAKIASNEPHDAAQSAGTVQRLKEQIYRNAAQPRSKTNVTDMTFEFTHTKLVPTAHHIAFDPVFVVSVDPKIIPNHTDFDTRRFRTFLQEFILAFATDQKTKDLKTP